jgi:hypothetical protein
MIMVRQKDADIGGFAAAFHERTSSSVAETGSYSGLSMMVFRHLDRYPSG